MGALHHGYYQPLAVQSCDATKPLHTRKVVLRNTCLPMVNTRAVTQSRVLLVFALVRPHMAPFINSTLRPTRQGDCRFVHLPTASSANDTEQCGRLLKEYFRGVNTRGQQKARGRCARRRGAAGSRTGDTDRMSSRTHR